jgi:hypothetical protein
MTSSLDQVLKLIPIDDLAKQVGASSADTAAAVKAALPGLLGGLTHNASSEEGHDALQKALAQHTDSKVLTSTGANLANVDTTDGAKIVNHVFGAKSTDVAHALSSESGTSSSLIQKVLPYLAPVVMAYLASKLFSSKTETATTTTTAAASKATTASKTTKTTQKAQETAASSGGDIIGSILSGALGGGTAAAATQSSDSGLGDILGGLLGGSSSSSSSSGGLTDILGGLLSGHSTESSSSSSSVLGSILGGLFK